MTFGIAFREDGNRNLIHTHASSLPLTLAALFDVGDFANAESFLDGNATLLWTVQNDQIFFGVEARCTGWLGVVFGQAHLPVMSDVIIGYLNGSSRVIQDAHATTTGWPPLDQVDNILSRAGPVQVGAKRQFMFSRLLDTGDAEDVPIPVGEIRVGIAFRNTDEPRKHTGRQSRTVVLRPENAEVFDPAEFASSLSFLDGKALVYYTVTDDKICFGVQAESTGWVGLVFNQAHDYRGSHMIVSVTWWCFFSLWLIAPPQVAFRGHVEHNHRVA